MEAFHALGARVVALVDPSPHVCTVARAVGAEVLDSPARLNAKEVDLVVVALPSRLQPGVSADLLRRGLRVLVEKPIGSSSANAAALGEIANVENALMVGYTLHHHPVAKVLADWVASATVISISIRSAARKSSIEGWRAAADEGGVAVVNGIHGIEYAASLFPGEATVHSTYQSDQLHRASVAGLHRGDTHISGWSALSARDLLEPVEPHHRSEPKRLVFRDGCHCPRRPTDVVELVAPRLGSARLGDGASLP